MASPTANVSFDAQPWLAASAAAAPSVPAAKGASGQLPPAAALLAPLSKLAASRQTQRAAHLIAADMKRHTGASQAGVALGEGSRCRLVAISDMAEFDRLSPLAQQMEAALHEALLRGQPTLWPAADDAQPHSALAHRQLCQGQQAAWALGAPLKGSRGNTVGALLLTGERPLRDPAAVIALLDAWLPPLADCLELVRRAEGSLVYRAASKLRQALQGSKGKAALAAVALLILALLLPVPHKIACDCRLQPVVRRFVVAPYDGTLEKSLVSPGQLVAAGQVLARMDGREIRWELAGLRAELSRAVKQHDAALAKGNAAASQLAALETQRLELKIELLEQRADNLDIKSAIAGIVVSGDHEKAEGAPLTIGQALFEIAPLERMAVEIAVPEQEIARVETGMQVELRFDAYPRQTVRGTIERIHPRAEIRDQQSVFVAELLLQNDGRLYRPGMNGKAKIVAGRRALGWVWFHKPAEKLAIALGW